MTRNSTSKRFRYGSALRRHLIMTGLTMLADATRELDTTRFDTLFLQAYNWTHAFASPSLRTWRAPALEVVQIQRRPIRGDPHGQLAKRRWETVRWWMEAWYLDGVFGADPPPETVEQISKDDPSEKTHHFAVQAYRRVVEEGMMLLADAATLPDRHNANVAFSRAYPFVRAIAHPILERLPEHAEVIARLWDDQHPEETERFNRIRQMEAVPVLVDAWHQAGVVDSPRVPTDPEAGTKLRETTLAQLQGTQHPHEDEDEAPQEAA